jgi:hypothetical protein
LTGVRLHDLRHTYASFGAGGGLGLPIIGRLLGHTQAATTARYAHLDNDPLRRASEAIAGRIAAALGGQPNGLSSITLICSIVAVNRSSPVKISVLWAKKQKISRAIKWFMSCRHAVPHSGLSFRSST